MKAVLPLLFNVMFPLYKGYGETLKLKRLKQVLLGALQPLKQGKAALEPRQ